MKKIIFLLLISSAAYAQQKPKVEPKPEPPKYEKFVKITPQDVNNFLNSLQQWKRLVMYDPDATPETQVQTYKNIETYTSQLQRTLKLDSALVKPDSVVVKPKKK